MSESHSTRRDSMSPAAGRSRDGRRGNTVASLVALLVIVGGAGGYNYHRNFQKEMAEKGASPFAGYADADLSALKQAYEQEISQYRARYETAKAHRVRTQGEGELLGEKVERFEKARQVGNAVREATADLADREARLRDIDKEIDRRARLGGGLSVHVQRLITI